MLDRPLTIEQKAFNAVTAEWRTAREIFSKVDDGAFTTTALALVRLAKAGKIDREYRPHPSGKILVYRRIA